MLQTHSWVIRLQCWSSQPASLPYGIDGTLATAGTACTRLLCHGATATGERWVLVGGVASFIMVLFIKAGWCYCLLPPLIVALCGILQFRLGFPSTAFLHLGHFGGSTAASSWLQYGLVSMDLPALLGALAALLLLFAYFHRSGKFFAPAAALTILPLLLPFPILPQLPLMVAVGSGADSRGPVGRSFGQP